ncbi:MAG TPA: hypothetical protein VNZ85_05885 [Caulobacter sp.]|nr:hypothetical protein [Caulobacter sp.]
MRYYFRLTDGETYDDNEGVDMQDPVAAEREAAKIAAEWLRDNPDSFVRDRVLKVQILDEERQLVATINIGINRRRDDSPSRRPGQGDLAPYR